MTPRLSERLFVLAMLRAFEMAVAPDAAGATMRTLTTTLPAVMVRVMSSAVMPELPAKPDE